jgi:hypothetical protein
MQQSACGISATAKAYSVNFTVAPQATLSFLSPSPRALSLFPAFHPELAERARHRKRRDCTVLGDCQHHKPATGRT